MTAPPRQAPRLRRLLPFGLLAATFVLMAAVSWYRWPEVIIDYGRELYFPWRISAGEMLYRDLPHLYGPLAHYVNAALFTLFGASLRTLVTFNLLLIGLLSLGIFAIFRRAYDRLTGTLCGLVFLGVFAFSRNTGQGNWNFVCPYTHEITYGIYLSFLLLPALEQFAERGTRRWAGAVGLLLGLVFLTKVEVFVAALVSAAAVAGLPAARSRSLRRFGHGQLPVVLAGFATPLLLFVALFSSRTTLAEAVRMVATTVTSLGRRDVVLHPFYRGIAGLDAPLASVVTMMQVAAVYAALVIGVLLVSRHVGRRGGVGRNRLLVAAVVLALGGFAWHFKDRIEWWALSGRAFPLVVLPYACRELWRSARRGGSGDGRAAVPAVAISVFGFFLLLKILLNVRFLYYGFALAMPATLVVIALAVHHLPELARRRGGCAVTARLLTTTLAALFVALQVGMSWTAYRHLTYPVGRGADRFYTFGPDVWNVGPTVNEALQAIETTMPKGADFVVMPEGLMLNYLSRRRNPARWYEFTPLYLLNVGEDRMAADLEAGRPSYVVLTERPTPEYGARYFGVDYGVALRAWVTDNYTPVSSFGDRLFSGRGFGIVIARRNGGGG